MPPPKRVAVVDAAASAKKPRALTNTVADRPLLFESACIRTNVHEYAKGSQVKFQNFICDSSESGFDVSAPFFGAWPFVTMDRGVLIDSDMMPYNMDLVSTSDDHTACFEPGILYLMPSVVEREDIFYHFLVPMVRHGFQVKTSENKVTGIELRTLTRDRLCLIPNVGSHALETFIYSSSSFDPTVYGRLAATYSELTIKAYPNSKKPTELHEYTSLTKKPKSLFFSRSVSFVDDCTLFQKTVWNAFAMQYDLPKVFNLGTFRDCNAIIGEWLNLPATHPFLSALDPTVTPSAVLAQLAKNRAELAAATAYVDVKNADLAAANSELVAVKAQLTAANAALAVKDAEIARLKSADMHQKTVQGAKQTVQSTDLADRVVTLEEELEFFRSITVSVATDASLDHRVQTLKALGQRVFQGLKLEHAQEYMAMFEGTGSEQRYMNFRKLTPDDVFDTYYKEWRQTEQDVLISPYDDLRAKLETMAVSWDKDRIMMEFKFVFAQMIEAIAASHMYGHMYTKTLQQQEQQLWRDAEQFTTLRDDVVQSKTALIAMEGFCKTMSHLGGSISKEVMFEDKWGMFNVGNVVVDVLEDALKYATRPEATSETVFEALMLGEGDTKICLSAMTARRFEAQSAVLTMFRQLCLDTHIVDPSFLSSSTHRMPLPQQNRITALHRALVASLGRPFLLSDPSSPDSKVNIDLLHQQFGLAKKLVADKTIVS